jgi:hypothetical protein
MAQELRSGELVVRVLGDSYRYTTDGGVTWTGWLNRYLQSPQGEVGRLVRSAGLPWQTDVLWAF